MLGDNDQTDPHTEQPFGRVLEGLRRAAGYKTQKAFSEAVGVSEPMIAHVEAGRRMPSEKTLARMLDAVDADEETRRRLVERRYELATSPTPTDVATLTAIVQKLVEAQERQYDELVSRIERLERRRAR